MRAVAARLGGGLNQRHPMYDGLDPFGSEIEIFDGIYSSAALDRPEVYRSTYPDDGMAHR
jgi:hypothetical protein